MGLTTDRNDPGLRKIKSDGQQEVYLVLSEEERAKGFVRPVRHAYRHAKCGIVTTMGNALAETYAINPKFYTGTYCCFCRTHFPLQTAEGPQFFWTQDGEPVGSNAEEATAWREERQRQEATKHQGEGI